MILDVEADVEIEDCGVMRIGCKMAFGVGYPLQGHRANAVEQCGAFFILICIYGCIYQITRLQHEFPN